MNDRRPPKKSETIEVRVPHEVKDALMRKARAEGRSASEVIRSSIDTYLADRSREKPTMLIRMWKPIAAGSAGMLTVLWLALAPAPLAAGSNLKAAFDKLDANHDQVISLDEFLGGNTDRVFVRNDPHLPSPSADKPFTLPLGARPPALPANAVPAPHSLLQSEFAESDLDGDGNVTFAEFKRHHVEMFHSAFVAIDGDGDGSVDRAEYGAATKGVGGGGAAASFDEVDANHDGHITEAEFSSGESSALNAEAQLGMR